MVMTKDKTRQLKRIYSQVFLEVLEQATGMKQSWGILTGIRPMKLYHKYRQRRTIIQKKQLRKLMKNYRVSREKGELLAKMQRFNFVQFPILYDIKR